MVENTLARCKSKTFAIILTLGYNYYRTVEVRRMKTLLWIAALMVICTVSFAQETIKGTPGIVDKQGKIYKKNHYKGVIPGIRDVPAVPSKQHPPKVDHPVVEWVGFQPFRDHSRVFIQILGSYTFTVTKKNKTLIEVAIPRATVATPNDARELVTERFPTMVKSVKIKRIEDPSGSYIAIDIYLKKDVGYLFHQEGKYVFVDVENRM